MAEKVTLARPYARAAFEAARDSKDFARWSEMLAAARGNRSRRARGQAAVEPARERRPIWSS